MAALLRWPPARAALLAAGLIICPGLACQAGPPATKAPMLSVANEDNGRTLHLGLGEVLRVVLRENAASGYRWELEHADTDVIELAAVNGDYANPALGSGGNAEFLFRGRQPGEGRIVLRHWRPWEGAASTVGRFCLAIRVGARN